MSQTMSPKPEVSMPVLWYPGGERNQQPHAAVITAINPFSVCVHVLSRDLKNYMIQDGCRHMDDKEARPAERAEKGGWDYPDWLKRCLPSPQLAVAGCDNRKEEKKAG